jgi:3-deoxy-D-manno-octulosonic-acid transferase
VTEPVIQPKRTFPTIKTRLFLVAYRVIWFICMPFVLMYLRKRAQKEPLYWGHMNERFGLHAQRMDRHVWIHAVSLGEMRSATFLIDQLLDRGEKIVVTHFTPAGRAEAHRLYPDAVKAGQLVSCWVPFDYDLAFRRFFKAFRPKYGLVMEVEFWPGMIMSSRKHGVPLFLCNGQYPSKSWERDKTKTFSAADIVPGFAGVLVKSDRMADPFRTLGMQNIEITGELRFDQPIDQSQAARGAMMRHTHLADRDVIVFASAIDGEDALFVQTMMRALSESTTRRPFFVYVPRHPNRFDEVVEIIESAGLRYQRRTNLDPSGLGDCDVLIGDSLGEMHFYLAFADRVVVGGGFVPKGSHNIIEPLLHEKPVIVGPYIWTIDFPAREAMDAGVCRMATSDTLFDILMDQTPWPAAVDFVKSMQGGAARSLMAVDRFLDAP